MKITRISCLIALFHTLFLWGCGESSTSSTKSEPGISSSSTTGASSLLSQSSGTPTSNSSGTPLSSGGTSEGTSSSDEPLSSSENPLNGCAERCERGKTYQVGESCMRSLHNWTALEENNQLPSEEYPALWRDDGECV